MLILENIFRPKFDQQEQNPRQFYSRRKSKRVVRQDFS